MVGILVLLSGFMLAASGYIISLFQPKPQDIFFSEIPELEELIAEKNKESNAQSTLALLYTDFNPHCPPMHALRKLQKNRPDTLDVTIYVDSSFRPHDVGNLKGNLGILFPVAVLPEHISEKWRELTESGEMSYEGVALLVEQEKTHQKMALNRESLVDEFLGRFKR